MPDNGFMLDAWSFETTEPLKLTSSSDFKSHCWYHCQRDHKDIIPWLGHIGMSESLIELLLDGETRPQYLPMQGDNFLLILRGVNLNEGDEPDDMISLRIIYYNKSVITLRRKPFKGIQSIQHSLEQKTNMPVTIAELLIFMIEQLNIKIEDTLDDIENTIDALESNLDTLTRQEQKSLTLIQRRLLRLLRFLKPQAVALQALQFHSPSILHAESQRLINEKEIAVRIFENIESNVQIVKAIRDDLHQIASERMSRNSYYLSLSAGVFLPVTFITGLFGINLGGMPGAQSEHAFYWFCLALLFMGTSVFLILRRFRFW